ncbi:unnamed protein product [Cylicocyclus nassatus]|uniref:Acyl_transf_3 domain-containing protein n=1 Tax=Cylicocyclus nassatus TaxID=53992 RepID=A0AA36MDB7_CYLNA|nr:unnamed protein product [Cylicocyclus nassatus]
MEKIKKTQEKSKRADLQGLRGLAIILVLLMHFNPKSCRLAFVGVDIFFVLSGYLMTKILLGKTFSLSSIWIFYCRRFKRIVPLYLVVILITYIYGYFYVLSSDRKQILEDLAWVCTYSTNLQPIFQKLGYWEQLSTYRFFVHTWSLGVELQYYVIAPLIMGIASYCNHGARLLLFFSLGAASISFQLSAAPNLSYGLLLSRIWQFVCGSIAYEMEMKVLPSQSEKCCCFSDEEQLTTPGRSRERIISPKLVSDTAARTSATLMAAIIIFLKANVFLLTNRFIIYCGDISYVLYLVHWPVIVAVRYCSDSQMLSTAGILIALYLSLTISVAMHHTFENYFLNCTMLPSLICVIICYACIFSSRLIYLQAPQLKITTSFKSKIEYAIEFNIKESYYYTYNIPCDKDNDTQFYTGYKDFPTYRCVAKGNGSVNILLMGDSVARRAYSLLHNILQGRYLKFRLFSRPQCPLLWCSKSMSSVMRKVVQHEKPDILLYMHRSYSSFNAPIKDLQRDSIYKHFQSNIDFMSNLSRHIVIDIPYCISKWHGIGAILARKLQLGLLPGDEFVTTWQQCDKQIHNQKLRLGSLKCDNCIMNDVNEALFKNVMEMSYTFCKKLVNLGSRSNQAYTNS